MKTPCSDYVETSGVIFFARMLEKIRLKTAGELPADYNFVGNGVWDSFDARFCRFFEVDETALTERALEGGTNEEILEWCFQKFGGLTRKKSAPGILISQNAAGTMRAAKSSKK
jgi:hypothetical protein